MRIKSILARYGRDAVTILPPETAPEKDLMLAITRFADNLQLAYRDSAPNVICAYIYELAGAVNKFYHETRILTEENEARRESYVALIDLARRILETSIHLLGFSAPEKM